MHCSSRWPFLLLYLGGFVEVPKTEKNHGLLTHEVVVMGHVNKEHIWI